MKATVTYNGDKDEIGLRGITFKKGESKEIDDFTLIKKVKGNSNFKVVTDLDIEPKNPPDWAGGPGGPGDPGFESTEQLLYRAPSETPAQHPAPKPGELVDPAAVSYVVPAPPSGSQSAPVTKTAQPSAEHKPHSTSHSTSHRTKR